MAHLALLVGQDAGRTHHALGSRASFNVAVSAVHPCRKPEADMRTEELDNLHAATR